jgi:hypothetical protein
LHLAEREREREREKNEKRGREMDTEGQMVKNDLYMGDIFPPVAFFFFWRATEREREREREREAVAFAQSFGGKMFFFHMF